VLVATQLPDHGRALVADTTDEIIEPEVSAGLRRLLAAFFPSIPDAARRVEFEWSGKGKRALRVLCSC